MTPPDWIALAALCFTVGGSAVTLAVKLTRLADAVDQLGRNMTDVRKELDDHEHRLTVGGL